MKKSDIPKIIHYCWFGPKPVPDLELKCIESWKKYFINYEFMLWNESTFDVYKYKFTKEAYENEAFAFVSDYVRAKVLYDYGGIYLDTDVEVLCNFNNLFKNYNAVLGFETKKQLGTAVMIFSQKHNLVGKLLKYYSKLRFETKGGLNIVANVSYLTDILIEQGLIIGGDKQIIENVLITNREVFYPKKISLIDFQITKETLAIHRCTNSWMSEKAKKRGRNRFWIKIMRPILTFFKKIGTFFVGKEKILSIEIRLRNYLK